MSENLPSENLLSEKPPDTKKQRDSSGDEQISPFIPSTLTVLQHNVNHWFNFFELKREFSKLQSKIQEQDYDITITQVYNMVTCLKDSPDNVILHRSQVNFVDPVMLQEYSCPCML